MKIQERKGVLDPRLGGAGGVQPESGAVVESPPPAAADRVSLSDAGRELARLGAEVGDLGGIREEKVSGLRAVMAKGHYSADLRDVARKLLRELLEQALA